MGVEFVIVKLFWGPFRKMLNLHHLLPPWEWIVCAVIFLLWYSNIWIAFYCFPLYVCVFFVNKFVINLLYQNACIYSEKVLSNEQVRYKKWLWWTRFATVVTVLQFAGASYLLYNMASFMSHNETTNHCILGKVCFFFCLSMFKTFPLLLFVKWQGFPI